ncbi:MAG: hypothetical protein VXZ96_19570 [Myxococcota bacterium]|nr:hypothetical protein [Myxococcota bacterium]
MTHFLITIACTTADSPKDNSKGLDGDSGTPSGMGMIDPVLRWP